MKNLRIFLVLTCVLAAVPAYAGSDLTLFGAAQHEGKLNVQSATSTASSISSFNPGSFGTFGIRYSQGKFFEHTLAYAPHFIASDGKAVIYNSDLLIQIPTPVVKPYFTAGLGSIFSFGTNSQGQTSFGNIGTKFAINYGGGIKIMPKGPVGVRFDIRGYTLPSVHFNLPALVSSGGTVQSQTQTLNMLEAGVGLVFKFGK